MRLARIIVAVTLLAAALASCDKQDDGATTRAGAQALAAKDYEKARSLFRQSCDAGDLNGCTKLADMDREGWGAPQDMHAATPLYQRACDGGVVAACFFLGVAKEEIQPSDMAAARADYKKACDGDYAEACLALGNVMRDAIPPDDAGGRASYSKACGLGNNDACALLAPMLHNGQGGPQDLAGARRLFAKLCDVEKNQTACGATAFMLHQGEGGPVDLPGARRTIAIACDAGAADSCHLYGAMLAAGEGGPADQDLAQVCQKPDPVGCGKYVSAGVAATTDAPAANGDAPMSSADAPMTSADAATAAHAAAPATAPAAPAAHPPAAAIVAPTAHPSFDCAEADNPAMRLICADAGLAQEDVDLAHLYKRARSAAADPRMVDTEQREWITEKRDACGSRGCLEAAYASRRSELLEWLR